MPDLIKLAKAKYENICKQLEAKEKEVTLLKQELRPIVIYLTEVGVLEREKERKNRGVLCHLI
ncbi:hypothetical protein MASR2M39_31910 [Ignavibacteriales bacterium]